jgi:hypothetical protein
MEEVLRQTNDLVANLELAPPLDPLPEPFWSAHGLKIAALLVLLAIAIAVWVRLRRRSAPHLTTPPAVQARRELQELRDRNPEALPIETSRIIKRFLVEQLRLPRHEFTTAELGASLRLHPVVPGDAAEFAAAFLRRCDLLKFSDATSRPETDLIAAAAEVVERFERFGTVESATIAAPDAQPSR